MLQAAHPRNGILPPQGCRSRSAAHYRNFQNMEVFEKKEGSEKETSLK